MPTPAEVLDSISSAISDLTGGRRMWSDIGTTFERITAGEISYQLKSVVTSINRNSNDARPALGLSVTVHYRRLTRDEEESSYTEGARLDHQQSLVDPLWWIAIPGVHSVVVAPDTSLSDLAREEDIISYQVTLGVVCVTP